MEVREINNKRIWEDFLLGCQEKTFLQSWFWGEFQKTMGDKIWRQGVYEDGDLKGVAQVFKVEARRGKFLFLPHGPVVKIFNFTTPLPPPSRLRRAPSFSIFKQKVLNALLEELKKIAEQERCGFIRVAPIWERTEENEKIFKDLGFRTAPLHTHAEVIWELNLEKSEEELLRAMRKTTRYLIKQGLKNEELKIEKSQNSQDIEVFNTLYQKTVDRHHFVPFSLDYLKNEFLAFLPDNQVLIFLAKYRGECLASAVVIFWQGIAFYHQGASVQKYPKVPASYLLQWEAIKEAKRRGCQLYNFWGIAETESKKHPFWGLSLFKKGFGGYEKKYVKTQDLPLSSKYWLTFVFEKLRKKKRGF